MDVLPSDAESVNEANPTLHVQLAAEIVAAYVSRNQVATDELGALISSVHRSIQELGNNTPAAEPEPLKPAVPIKKSITPDYLVCLEDGHKLKMLKRHLSSRYGLTPEEYRKKWGLPHDYPMVAPSYAATRSQLAKSIGLGLGGKAAPAKAAPAKRATRSRKKTTAA
ncbi:MucR family transcriptional regulator [Marinivivus vitaminiproducens]|uniref:MucR family transcriptional regulator n=1 Tax=Marinivivus vitaminiproducens TaxID=3035935 RepID=UPI00279A646C|nr:MucR family transcriptional regulator [Geminicoccaceae bacterium SCSIO 64248]